MRGQARPSRRRAATVGGVKARDLPGPAGRPDPTPGGPPRRGGRGAVVGAVGLGVYVLAVGLGVNRAVVPVPPTGHWWTVPVLLLAAARSGLLEEVIVAGYLLRRLDQLGWSPSRALAASALLRGAYHPYQGFCGFVGNPALGLVFGRI